MPKKSNKPNNMLSKFIKPFAEVQEENVVDVVDEKTKSLALDEVAGFVRSIFVGDAQIQKRLLNARSGILDEALYVENKIVEVLNKHKKLVQGMSAEDAASLIYSKYWGLGVCEKYSRDLFVSEIRVNAPDKIFIIKHGRSYHVPESFDSEDDVEIVIKRMLLGDVGAFIDKSNPVVESVRKDGSRLTATCPPVTNTWTFVLRKHDVFQPTLENYIKVGTMDQKCWDMLSLLSKGRASIIVSGNVGSGKTTLMRALSGEFHDKLRIVCIGRDSELRLSEHYPERDIVEMEEHAHVGATMPALFNKILRYSPDIIITEEFRDAEETLQAIRACGRGLPGSMASAHFSSAQEAIEGAGLMLIEQGLNLSLEMAKLRIARAFNIVVQLYGDVVTGNKKLISITEVCIDGSNSITFRELVCWQPGGPDYLGSGYWEIVDPPSEKLIRHLLKSVDRKELEVVGWNYPEPFTV